MNNAFGIILAIAAFASAGTSFAGNIYVTGNATITNTTVKTDGESVLDRIPMMGMEVDSNFEAELNNSLGFGIGVGLDINNWLAVEGTVDWLGRGTDNNLAYQARAFTGWVVVDPTVATIASMPLKVTGRVGYAASKLYIGGEHCSDNQIAYGAGVALGVTNNVDVILDYRARTTDADGISINFNTVNLGAKYAF